MHISLRHDRPDGAHAITVGQAPLWVAMHPPPEGDFPMSDTNSALADLEDRIAILEDNLGNLIEEAAAYSGAGDDDRSSDRIAELEAQIDALKKQRDALR
jgi:hypothetical protein